MATGDTIDERRKGNCVTPQEEYLRTTEREKCVCVCVWMGAGSSSSSSVLVRFFLFFHSSCVQKGTHTVLREVIYGNELRFYCVQ